MGLFPVNGGRANGLAFIQIHELMIAFAKGVSASAVHMRLGIAGEFKKHDEWALWATRYHGERASAIDRAGERPAQPGYVVENGFSYSHILGGRMLRLLFEGLQ